MRALLSRLRPGSHVQERAAAALLTLMASYQFGGDLAPFAKAVA